MAMNDNNNDDNNTDKHSNPVTVIVKRIAKKDKIKEFEEWLSGISKEVSRQDGSMGIDNCYYSCNINSAIDYGSSTTFFNRKVINTISNKTCHAITITVLLMTYVIMPLLTKLLKPWLFKTYGNQYFFLDII